MGYTVSGVMIPIGIIMRAADGNVVRHKFSSSILLIFCDSCHQGLADDMDEAVLSGYRRKGHIWHVSA